MLLRRVEGRDAPSEDVKGAVRTVQEMLNFIGVRVRRDTESGTEAWERVGEDGVFGPQTEAAVIQFQKEHSLFADGLVGRATMQALDLAYTQRNRELHSLSADTAMAVATGVPREGELPGGWGVAERQTLVRAPADKWNGDGYDRLTLRDDAASAYRVVYREVHAKGGLLTSSGGLRDLDAAGNANRSSCSFHYLGRALDLFIYSGMVAPDTDPYVLERTAPRQYRVWARCSETTAEPGQIPARITIKNVVTYKKRTGSGTDIEDHFLDLTALFESVGFKSIRARPSFEDQPDSNILSAEWWHFQYEKGLVKGASTFGQELLKVYARSTLEGKAPWDERDRVFGIDFA